MQQKILDKIDLTALWLLQPQCRPHLLRLLRSTAAQNRRRWHFQSVVTDHCLVIGRTAIEIERRARVLGLVFLALPSALIFSAAALGIPGSHLMILSISLSLASVWMMARIKVQRLNGFPE